MEKFWVMLIYRLHAAGEQFESINELQEKLNNSYHNFCQTKIQSLYDSLPNRIF